MFAGWRPRWLRQDVGNGFKDDAARALHRRTHRRRSERRAPRSRCAVLRRCSVPHNNNLGDTEVGIDVRKIVEEQSPMPGAVQFTLVVDRRLRLTFAFVALVWRAAATVA